MAQERLNKILQARGIASRRAADKLIEAGRVSVNGKIIKVLGTKVDPAKATIVVNRKALPRAEAKCYFMLNKPTGFICSNARFGNEKLAVDLIKAPQGTSRLFSIGRLDKETKGLLLLTNDGDFAHQIMHPSFGIQKEYIVKVHREVELEDLKAMSEGIFIDGKKVSPKKVVKIRKGTLKIIVTDGKKHEVRKIVESSKFTIRELKRTRIGSLSLADLPEGASRPLTEKEVNNFKNLNIIKQ